MSEKRFKAVDGTFKHIIEDKEQKRVYLMSLYEHNQEVADLLNSLVEENEQLRQRNDQLSRKIEYLHKVIRGDELIV